jgi:hypothetical protein
LNHQTLLSQLHQKGIISDSQNAFIKNHLDIQAFSIHWELRTLLYLGILVLSTGLGILIYQNVNSLGHAILIGVLAILCIGCFLYTFKYIKPFSPELVIGDKKLEDFSLLAGCLTFLSLEGYLQYQYNFIGESYQLAAFIPAVFFFLLGYRFDHRGVLSMAITALASGVGVSITPVKLWQSNDFNSEKLVLTALILGIVLIANGWLSEKKEFKKHFSFTYFFLGGNMAFIAALVGLFEYDYKVIYFIVIAILAALNIIYAREKHSYIFMLMGVIFGYIALTYAIFKLLPNDIAGFFVMTYFILSGGGVIVLLLKLKELVGLKK